MLLHCNLFQEYDVMVGFYSCISHHIFNINKKVSLFPAISPLLLLYFKKSENDIKCGDNGT